MTVSDDDQAISALELRLHRLEHYLAHDLNSSQETVTAKERPINSRIAHLEKGLSNLASRNPTISSLITLRTSHPEFFEPFSRDSSSLTTEEQLAAVTASAPSFPETASRLDRLKDLEIPSTQASLQLTDLRTRIEGVHEEQEEQRRIMQDLRGRSAKVIRDWHELAVLGMGECWVEWEGRVEEVEKQVRRRERARLTEEQAGQVYGD